MAIDARTDKLLRSILHHAYTSKDLKEFIAYLECVAGAANTAIVKESIRELSQEKN